MPAVPGLMAKIDPQSHAPLRLERAVRRTPARRASFAAAGSPHAVEPSVAGASARLREDSGVPRSSTPLVATLATAPAIAPPVMCAPSTVAARPGRGLVSWHSATRTAPAAPPRSVRRLRHWTSMLWAEWPGSSAHPASARNSIGRSVLRPTGSIKVTTRSAPKRPAPDRSGHAASTESVTAYPNRLSVPLPVARGLRVAIVPT
jgi:hypothetical protein